MYNQTKQKFTFKASKALECLLYITSSVQDMYTALKIIYFADKMHLSKYGRFIFGDSYVAMRNGPVPSETYDMIKHVRGDGFYESNLELEKCFKIEENKIIPLRGANSEKLSESDIECLNKCIEQYKNYSFKKLKTESHDSAYNSADENDFISVMKIAETLDNKENIKKYLNELY